MTALPISERLQQSIEARIQAASQLSNRRAATMDLWRIFDEQLNANRARIGISASAANTPGGSMDANDRVRIANEFKAIAAIRAKSSRK